MNKKIRQVLSEKILDFVEKLPLTKIAWITALQNIRLHQRKFSAEEFKTRQNPENCNVNLRQITLTITFEFEDFIEIRKGLYKKFAHIDSIQEFIQDLKINENKLYYSGWRRIGAIAQQQGVCLSQIEIDESLPSCVKYVHISYHRILPSIAMMVFDFRIMDEVSEVISTFQNKEYLQQITFYKFLPITKIHLRYSSKSCISVAQAAIEVEINTVKSSLIKWISKSFNYSESIMESISFLDVYEINGNPKETEEFKRWVMQHRWYLEGYRIAGAISTYLGGNTLYCRGQRTFETKYYTDIVTKIDTTNPVELGYFLEYNTQPFIASVSLYNLLNRYQNQLENLKEKGFKKLYNSKKNVLKNTSEVQELKKLIIILNRLKHELNSDKYMSYSTLGTGVFKDLFRHADINLGKSFVIDIQSQIKSMYDVADIIDAGVTSYITAENIYVTYKLQRILLMLALIGTIIAFMGMFASWSNIKQNIITFVVWIKSFLFL